MKSTRTRNIILVIVAVAIIAAAAITIGLLARPSPEEIGIHRVLFELNNPHGDANNNIERVNIINDRVEIRFRNSSQEPNRVDAFVIGRVALENVILEHARDLVENTRFRIENSPDIYRNDLLVAELILEANRNFLMNVTGEPTVMASVNRVQLFELRDAYYSDYTMYELLTGNFYRYVSEGGTGATTYERRYFLDEILSINSVTINQARVDSGIAAAWNGFLSRQLRSAVAPHEIEITFNNRGGVSFFDFLPLILMVVVIGAVIFIFFRVVSGQTKGASSFTKNKSVNQSNSKIKFTDVAGAEEEKVELAELVEFLKAPDKFRAVGAKVPRGVLLVGPPGTGKTLFARAVAGEAGVPFFSISGSDFVEMFVGVGASRVRDLFEQAKKQQPSIIFIDEIDAVGRQRGAGLGGGHDEREQTLNQLLVQMDGFEPNDGTIVMAATNRADILDKALLRPGRFDRQIFVNLPDVRGREAILKVHARNKPISPEVDFQNIARITSGFSGADLANILNEAAILCARDNRKLINMNDITEGIDKATLGPQKKSKVVTELDKRVTAYHEAGHAIMAKLVMSGYAVHEVSIIPRGGGAGGFCRPRPETDNQMNTLKTFKADIAMTMGGRAAEKLVIQDISTGASSDIKMATNLARNMVMKWGMSGNLKLGQVNYDSEEEVFIGRSYQSTTSYSDATAAEIDKEVIKLVEEGYQTALTTLQKNMGKMDIMARVLLECETIYAEEVDMIMNGSSAEEVKASLEARFAVPSQAEEPMQAEVAEEPMQAEVAEEPPAAK